MKALGIIRKIDELGRIVIPKEIRDTYGLTIGTPMEMFTDDDGGIVFKRYFSLESKIIDKINKLNISNKEEIVAIIQQKFSGDECKKK